MIDNTVSNSGQSLAANGAQDILAVARELGISALKKADSWKPPAAFADQEYGLLWDAAITAFLECLLEMELREADLDFAAMAYLQVDNSPRGPMDVKGIQAAFRAIIAELLALHKQKEGGDV